MEATSKFSVYHFNLFKPLSFGIYHIAVSQDKDQIALIKKHVKPNPKIGVVSIVEIYRTRRNSRPKKIQSFVKGEDITGIAWIDSRFVIIASRELTIAIYDTHSCLCYNPIISDYGPILCLQYLPNCRLLITGTEYGYVAAYKISRLDEFKWQIEPVSKMVKVSRSITAIDIHVKIREGVAPVPEEPQWPDLKPKKRKRKNSDGTDDDIERQWLDDKIITIYGASGPEIVAWNFHKTTIVDTMRIGLDDNSKVCSVMSLRNGDVVVGDSTGTLSIFDHKTLTCRQSLKILEAAVLSLSKDIRDERIIAGGEDPSIVFIKRDKVNNDDFFLGERIEFHTHPIMCLRFITSKLFFSASLDGHLARFERITNQLDRVALPPSFRDQVKFSTNEMMEQYERSLHIWTMPKIDYESLENLKGDERSKLEPEKSIYTKASSYIHSSTFDSKWIIFATSEGLHIKERTEDGLVEYQTKRKVQPFKSVILCNNGQFIFGCHNKSTSIIRLDTVLPPEEEGGPPILDVSYGTQFDKTSICSIMYIESSGLLVSATSAPHSTLLIDKISLDSEKVHVKKFNRIALYATETDDGISFMVNDPSAAKDDPHIFVYGNNDELMRISVKQKFDEKPTGKMIQDLPKSSTLLGMRIIDKDFAIVWDRNNFYKICLNEYRVINQNSDYGSIIELSNGLFDDCHNIALAELTDDAYRKLLPAVHDIRKKFGA